MPLCVKVLLVWRTLLDDPTGNLTSNFKELTAVRYLLFRKSVSILCNHQLFLPFLFFHIIKKNHLSGKPCIFGYL